jgi:RimJ/RimL family protein N-acetyltransferase
MINPILLDIPGALETERLVLRAPRAGDGPMVQAGIDESFGELARWLPWAAQRQPLEATEAFLRKAAADYLARTDLAMLMFRRDDGSFVGGTGLTRIDWSVPRMEIGYWCRTAMIGHGYVTEATRALGRFAFDVLGARRVEIHCDASNARSRRVAELGGFVLEGTLRKQALAPSGAVRDTCVYALVDDERDKLG